MLLIRVFAGAVLLSHVVRVTIAWRHALAVLTLTEYKLLWWHSRTVQRPSGSRLKIRKHRRAAGRMARLWRWHSHLNRNCAFTGNALGDCAGSAVWLALMPAPGRRGKVAASVQVKRLSSLLITLVSIGAIFVWMPKLRGTSDAKATGTADGAGRVIIGTSSGRITSKIAKTTSLLTLTTGVANAGGVRGGDKTTDVDGQGGTKDSATIGGSVLLTTDATSSAETVGFGLKNNGVIQNVNADIGGARGRGSTITPMPNAISAKSFGDDDVLVVAEGSTGVDDHRSLSANTLNFGIVRPDGE